jgi:hypothetical protein
MNQVFDNARTKVLNAFPSIYTKDDVIKLINELQTEAYTHQQTLPKKDGDELQSILLEALERAIDNMDSSDIVDYDTAEMSINYRNHVELESIDANCREIFSEIQSVVNREFEEYFSESEETLSNETTSEV